MSDLFSRPKPVIAMAHLRPLPGSPGYDAGRGVEGLIEAVAADIERLQDGGVDAIMFGNEGDRPYVLQAPAEGLAAMSAIVAALKPALKVPFGVNYLWDAYATVALAVATGASFAREVFTRRLRLRHGAVAAGLRRRATPPGAASAGPTSSSCSTSTPSSRPRSTPGRSSCARAARCSRRSADAICVSGPLTGQPVDGSELKRVKAAVPGTPVLANTGVNIDNVAAILEVADGCVIGTHFKVGGDTWNPVDRDRVERFMDRVAKLR